MNRILAATLALACVGSLAQAQSLDQVISQNNGQPNGNLPAYLPPDFSWYAKGHSGLGMNGPKLPPADFTAVNGWWHVYAEKGKPLFPCRIILSGFNTYVHRKTGGWLHVEKPDFKQEGAHFVANFAGNAGMGMTISAAGAGAWSMPSPPANYNNHGWPVPRGTYPAGSIDGVYTTVKMRVDKPDCSYLAMVGVDWWRNGSAPYVDGFGNNPGVGLTNWVKLGTTDTQITFTQRTVEQLKADPPPGLILAAAPNPPPTPTPAPVKRKGVVMIDGKVVSEFDVP